MIACFWLDIVVDFRNDKNILILYYKHLFTKILKNLIKIICEVL